MDTLSTNRKVASWLWPKGISKLKGPPLAFPSRTKRLQLRAFSTRVIPLFPTKQPSKADAEPKITDKLTHVNSKGEAQMVFLPPPFDLSSVEDNQGQQYKPPTTRTAIASSTVIFSNALPLHLLGATSEESSLTNKDHQNLHKAKSKGDILSTARIAGISAAKVTSSLIPLCHNIPLAGVAVDISISLPSDLNTYGAVEIRTRVTSHTATGVEMEALTAASVAGLTVYDMLKAVDRGMQITNVRVVEKRGGKSGDWVLDENTGELKTV